MDSDAQLARRLQEDEEREARSLQLVRRLQQEEEGSSSHQASLVKPMSPVDPEWETLDPNPDLHSLFVTFNQTYFWGKLLMCEVKWSPRMTTCAGGIEGRIILNGFQQSHISEGIVRTSTQSSYTLRISEFS